jgi:hypothetical protein
MQASLSRLLPLIISAVNEDWYKIIAEVGKWAGSWVIVTFIAPVHS